MKIKELEAQLNQLLSAELIKDYCPNGLQIEGDRAVKKLVTGVTATQALIDKAVSLEADAILVHHGFFWKNESACITGMKRKRIAALLNHGISLFAYHLPLDVHLSLGNNAQLAQVLEIADVETIEHVKPAGVLQKGRFTSPIALSKLAQKVETKLARKPLVESGGEFDVQTIAWCTGGGQSFIEQAVAEGVDAFITGEVSEQTIHVAREMGIHFIAAGHHATERYGVKALGEYLAKEYHLDVEFVDINNPA
ncbi:Nif3-like dinuclear metal center hexameric protein [Catenovulum sediminis]|uniref:Nif3-like dinuclear metal center hexameric protein n=1 Tax=Catenovulum sediminis TaxID=1740262 RepID=A0ABV1RJ84_9ALTE